MAKLKAEFSPTFRRDLKKLDKQHIDDTPLAQVIDLIIINSPESQDELFRYQNDFSYTFHHLYKIVKFGVLFQFAVSLQRFEHSHHQLRI